MKISRRDSTAILEALSGGVVPSRGLQHIMVGRKDEGKQILEELKSVSEGESIVKFLIGDFGSGKSFIQGLIKQVGLNHDFVVTKADLSADKRLSGVDRARPLYTDLIKSMSTKTTEGNALNEVLDKWITNIQSKVKKSDDFNTSDLNDAGLVAAIKIAITEEVKKMDFLSGGYDFSTVLVNYFEGFINGDIETQRNAIRWISGEYTTRTEARQDLGVRSIIDDESYYDYLKVLSHFVQDVGYAGLIVNFDEAINLYKITHTVSRERNYEMILSMFNDCLQGSLGGLYITFSGTHDFLKDERRGLYSYGALRRRLEVNRYETDEFRDMSQPVIQLTPLKQEEIFVLLTIIRDIHAKHHKYDISITSDEIKGFIIQKFSMPGADQFTTVGHVIKRFLDGLNILLQNPTYDKKRIFIQEQDEAGESLNVMDRFQST